jgi:hypothetical protein
MPMKRAPLTLTLARALVLALLAVISFGASAAAEEKQPIEIRVKITSRVPRPMAAIDVVRVAPKLGVADLRKPVADRIEQVIATDPF